MPQLNLKPMYPNILNNKMNKIFRNLLRLKMTYVTIDNKDNEPIFEILLVFQHLYPDKNMADMETNLVMVENFFDFLELRMTYSIRKKMNSFQRL
jgi:Trk K+ transport system NAD-binding subunit